MPFALETDIKAIGLSARTTNALIKNGVKTVQDLFVFIEAMAEDKRPDLKGLGIAGIEEIKDLAKRSMDAGIMEVKLSYSFDEYWMMIQTDERNLHLLVDFYNGGSRTTLQEIGDKYSVTRERVRQIVAKGTKRIRDAFMNGTISAEILGAIDRYADNRTEVHEINIADSMFTGTGIAYLVAALDPTTYKVYTDPRLNGDWFIKTADGLGKVLDMLIDELRHRPDPLQIEDIEKLFSINSGMLMSIKGVIEKDGYVTHEKNKVAVGTDRHQIITRYLDAVERPASIAEIVENTPLEENQVRGTFINKDKYVNVGRSIYDFVDRKYEDATIEQLAVNILLAERRALKMDVIINYIRKYKNVNDLNISAAILSAPGLKKHDEYILLSGWGLDKIEKRATKTYYIALEDAVLEAMNSSDDVFTSDIVAEYLENKYKDAVSTNVYSIRSTLNRLADKKLIERVGGLGTGCYVRKEGNEVNSIAEATDLRSRATLGSFVNANIGKLIEIRYDSKNIRNTQYWRVISVKGQNARYIYTNQVNKYGHQIKYLKEKVLEYRECTAEEVE